MMLKVGAKVRAYGKVCFKDKTNEVVTKNLNAQSGTVKKVDKANDAVHYYVETKYGVHYLHNTRVKKRTV